MGKQFPILLFIMNYSLPKKVTIDGEEHAIRYDFRCILDIISMLNEQELTESEKAKALIYMFYVDPEKIRDPNEAIEKCFEFIDNGETKGKSSPKLIDWEQDFNYIVAPISRVVGKDIRETEYDEETRLSELSAADAFRYSSLRTLPPAALTLKA